MKKTLLNKTAALLSFIMAVSVLAPMMAFAAPGFTGAPTNSNYAVSGQVYISEDAYQLGVKPVLYLVYNEAGQHVFKDGEMAIADVTYANSANGSVYFNYSVGNSAYSTYNALYFRYFYDDSLIGVSDWVYRTYDVPPIFFPGLGGGTNIDGSLSADASGYVSASALAAALADGKATIKISGDVANLPASALTKTGTLEIVNADGVAYILPLEALDVDAIAAQLGVSVDNLTISVQIKALTGSDAASVNAAVEAVGGDVIAPVVDFKISAVGGGKTQELTNFSKYISRKLPLSAAVANPNEVTGVVYSNGVVSFVPTTVATENSKSVATLKRNSNSIYTVIKVAPKSFGDLNGHWAKADVEKLAGKLVITGTSATTFEPKRPITRAEVAALVVRSLGLDTTVANSAYTFSDVSAGKWYSNVVSAAAAAGIVNGYQDGTFKPDAAITRRDLAAMVVRAQAFAGKTVTLTDAQVAQALAGYTDAATLGGQRVNVAIAVSSGLMKGQTGNKLAGLANTNRAEAATLIARLLQGVDFID